MLWRFQGGSTPGASPPHGGSRAKGAFTVKLNVSLIKCGRCGKRYNNPLTHRCVTHTDFKRRKAAAAKGHSRPASTGNAHEPAECKDDDCPRYGCKMYKEGYENGYGDGHGAGYGAGRSDGYAEGYADGAATAEGA